MDLVWNHNSRQNPWPVFCPFRRILDWGDGMEKQFMLIKYISYDSKMFVGLRHLAKRSPKHLHGATAATWAAAWGTSCSELPDLTLEWLQWVLMLCSAGCCVWMEGASREGRQEMEHSDWIAKIFSPRCLFCLFSGCHAWDKDTHISCGLVQ